jgi:hypothetical protein
MKKFLRMLRWAANSLWAAVLSAGIVCLAMGLVCNLAGQGRAQLHVLGALFAYVGAATTSLCLISAMSFFIGRLFKLNVAPAWFGHTMIIGMMMVIGDLAMFIALGSAGVDVVTSTTGTCLLLIALLGIFLCLVVAFFLKGAIVAATLEFTKPEKARRFEVIDGGRRFTPHEPIFGVSPRKTHDPNQERPN